MPQEKRIIKNKLGLLKLAQTLGRVSEACKVLGFSRNSFYRFKELYDTGGGNGAGGDFSQEAESEKSG